MNCWLTVGIYLRWRSGISGDYRTKRHSLPCPRVWSRLGLDLVDSVQKHRGLGDSSFDFFLIWAAPGELTLCLHFNRLMESSRNRMSGVISPGNDQCGWREGDIFAQLCWGMGRGRMFLFIFTSKGDIFSFFRPRPRERGIFSD